MMKNLTVSSLVEHHGLSRDECSEFLGSCPCVEREVVLLNSVSCWLCWLQVCWSDSGTDFYFAGVSS